MCGELSIMYLLSQNSLVSKQPTIKCDIIEAKNALKLHESDVNYFYKPDIISEEQINDINYFKMVFKIPNNYTIPNNMEFKFSEYCFGNKWYLTWNGKQWEGNNCQGKSNKKVWNKCNKRAEIKTPGGAMLDVRKVFGAWVMIKDTEFNNSILPAHSKRLMYAVWENSTRKCSFLMKDGTIKKCEDYYHFEVQQAIDEKFVQRPDHSGYSYMPVQCVIPDVFDAGITVNEVNNMSDIVYLIDQLYVDMFLPNQTKGIRLSFRTGDCNLDGHFEMLNIDGMNDTIEKLEYTWEKSEIKENCKDIELYLNTSLVDPIEEVNWDTSTNPFEYIIQQQFYELSPNPNAATTLYTDYNITSSKIITADNITTMRSDLNIVTNNVDVIDFDVKELTSKVETLKSDMAVQQLRTQYLESDVSKLKVKANVSLAFNIIQGVSGLLSAGLELASGGIILPDFNRILQGGSRVINGGLFRRLVRHNGLFYPPNDIPVDNLEALPLFRSLIEAGERISHDTGNVSFADVMDTTELSEKTSIAPVLAWCNNNYCPTKAIKCENEYDDPETATLTVSASIELCNFYRSTLKTPFKLLATKINEIESDFETALTNYINKNELTRDDKIDITVNVDKENNNILFEAEDNINTGLLVFQVYVGNDAKQFRRRVYIKVIEGQIEEYKGVQEDMEVNDPVSGENVSLKLLAHSEEDRVAYFPDIIIEGKTITIESQNEYRIWGVVIEYNSFTRHLTLTPNDLAYRIDIEALDKKINALAEQSYSKVVYARLWKKIPQPSVKHPKHWNINKIDKNTPCF